MKICLPPAFSKQAVKDDISDHSLSEAVARANRGQVDAQLGAFLIKQRVARLGQGRSGGHRVILAYKRGDVAVPLYTLSKNQKANLTKNELEAFRDYADQLAKHTDEQFSRLVNERGWRQIDDEQPEEDVPK
jgi:hypothetical protein